MRIVQLLPTLSFGDAVSNDAAAIHRMIGELGYEPELYAVNIDKKVRDLPVRPVKEMEPLGEEDVLIYHGSTGDPLNTRIFRMKGRKLIRYHNITPPHFFHAYSAEAELRCAMGYREMQRLAGAFDRGLADSDYNRQDMRRLGFRCPVDVCPILIPWEDYAKEPDARVLETYGGDGWTNLLFVGRIAPNKRQENVIRAFYDYHWRYNARSRLFLVGNSVGMEAYRAKLEQYVKQLGLAGRVVFTGQTRFPEILAYYRLADVFLCMSEHEGFCVPLLEAMYFGVPVVALKAAAVPETIGNAGILLDSDDPGLASAAVDRVIRDEKLRQGIREIQKKRLVRYSYEAVSRRMEQTLLKMIGGS